MSVRNYEVLASVLTMVDYRNKTKLFCFSVLFPLSHSWLLLWALKVSCELYSLEAEWFPQCLAQWRSVLVGVRGLHIMHKNFQTNNLT